jgi:hypothetical protein
MTIFKKRKQKPPRTPWWTQDTIASVERILKPDMRVFEWGSGSSTVWLAHRTRRVWSVDHDKFWRAKIRTWARREGVSRKIKVFIYPLENIGYYDCVNRLKEDIDFIAVDGRNRVECFKKAAQKLSRGGYLMVDDTHRPYYSPIYEVGGFEIICDVAPDETGKKATVFRKI